MVGVPVRVHSRTGDDLGVAHVPPPIELGDVLELGHGPILLLRVVDTTRGVLERRQPVDTGCTVSIYRLHDTTGEDLGLLEHFAPNLEAGDLVVLADGREAVVTARVEAEPGPGPLVAMLEVAINPPRVEAGDALP